MEVNYGYGHLVDGAESDSEPYELKERFLHGGFGLLFRVKFTLSALSRS